MSDDRHIELAKALIRENLSRHPDPGVRLINEFADVDDAHPGVRKIAEQLATLSPADFERLAARAAAHLGS